MADDCSFLDFSHNVICTERRYVVACVTHNSTGTYITVKFFKKDNFRYRTQDNTNNCNSDGFKFNQRIILSLAEFEQLSQSTLLFTLWKAKDWTIRIIYQKRTQSDNGKKTTMSASVLIGNEYR